MFGLVFSSVLWLSTAFAKNYIVVLDPGHGGTETGAIGGTGLRESDFVLDLALRTEEKLKEQGITVILTRRSDLNLTLQERAETANTSDANLFLSIHANASPSSSLYGIETYSVDVATDASAIQVANRENDSSDFMVNTFGYGNLLLSIEFSELVQHNMVTELRKDYPTEEIVDLGHKTAMFSVLVRTKMPAILFEAGFLSNPSEERQLRTAHYRDAMAEALADSILEWLERGK
jgi:N-acetylmuramoyl-L-alanine amidase